jgi:hypothetical protein
MARIRATATAAAVRTLAGTLILALLWAGWHLPLFLVPGWTSSPVWAYILLLTGASVILTVGVNISGLSVLPAIAGHAAFNTISRWVPLLVAGAQPRVRIPFTTLLAVSGIAAALSLVAVSRGKLWSNRNDAPA